MKPARPISPNGDRHALGGVCVVIPARNEAASLPLVLGDLPSVGRIIVVDNGSIDGTATVAKDAGAIVVHEERLGYGSACLAGLSWLDRLAAENESTPNVVVFLDGDYSDHPDLLPQLVEPILTGRADFVLGSRLLGCREPGAMPPQSIFGNRLACFLMRILWGVRYTDLGPFRAIRYDALRQLRLADRPRSSSRSPNTDGRPDKHLDTFSNVECPPEPESDFKSVDRIPASLETPRRIRRRPGDPVCGDRLADFAFVYGEGFQQRPILLVVGLLAACFGLYAASLAIALKLREDRSLIRLIAAGAVSFRGILLFSQPIQEADIYRYLWDGALTSQGANPFWHPPADILSAHSKPLEAHGLSAEIRQLVRLLDESPGLAEALRRIQHPELTTIYPPVSLAVFAAANRLTPTGATLFTRVRIMKAALLTFDLATALLAVWLLRISGKHLGWGVAYAWCPLVMKEFANSGHLDSIAVCLTTASVCCTARLCQESKTHSTRWAAACGVLLGLSVGAKLYPIVLLPLLTWVAVRRAGIRNGALLGIVALCASGACLAPMLSPPRTDFGSVLQDEGAPQFRDKGIARSEATDTESIAADTRSGLSAFVSRWEMNDFLFLIVVENLRDTEARTTEPQAWFSIVPNSLKSSVLQPLASSLAINHDRAAFLLARALTTGLFLGIVIIQLKWVAREACLKRILEAAFLTLAWFWLLLPTQNPWYWIWALPLIPFARGRAWLAVSGLVLIYYLRFWLLYHWPEPGILGARYDGKEFFDLFVTWIEFGPWFAWLSIEALSRRLKSSSNKKIEAPFVSDFTEEPGAGS